MKTEENLIPFKKGFDERRRNGRKKGSKNISTIIQNILEADFPNIKSNSVKELIQKHGSKTAKEAIILAVTQKALNGDMKATEWLFGYLNKNETAKENFFNSDIKIEIIDPKHKV